MQEVIGTHTVEESVDSYSELLLRGVVNNWGSNPVDFYRAGYEKANEYLSLYNDSVLADIGSGPGQRTYDGLKSFNQARIARCMRPIWPHLIGIDPLYEHMSTLNLSLDPKRFTFLQSKGEYIPLPDNTVDVTTAHRVIYRAEDQTKMFNEMKRITLPGGLIIVTTCFRDHAPMRYFLESMAQTVVSQRHHLALPELLPPAEGSYFEDLPEIVGEIGGLRIIDQSIVEKSTIKISENRLKWYIEAMKMSAKRTSIPLEYHHEWRKVMDNVIEPYVLSMMQEDKNGMPIFTDSVHRGMAVMVNEK